MAVIASKDGKTKKLANNPQVNAYIRSGYTITVNDGKIVASDGRKLFNTPQFNAYLREGWELSTTDGPAPVPKYTITFTSGANGSLTGTTTSTVDAGTLFSTITVPTPVPSDGYEFDSWSPTLPSGSTAINSNLSFTAQFTEEQVQRSGAQADIATLKAEADSLGVEYRDNIGYEKLLERVEKKKEEANNG